jgi:hypothetical protein
VQGIERPGYDDRRNIKGLDELVTDKDKKIAPASHAFLPRACRLHRQRLARRSDRLRLHAVDASRTPRPVQQQRTIGLVEMLRAHLDTYARSDGEDGPQHDAHRPDLSACHPRRRPAHRRRARVRNRAGRRGRVGHAADSTRTARRRSPPEPPPRPRTQRPGNWGVSGSIWWVCGCSSMAEHQLPKLTVRVRFSSPAPTTIPVAAKAKSATVRCRCDVVWR